MSKDANNPVYKLTVDDLQLLFNVLIIYLSTSYSNSPFMRFKWIHSRPSLSKG